MPNEHGRFKFVAVGPWDGWTQEEIEREILGGPAVVLPPFDEEDDDE